MLRLGTPVKPASSLRSRLGSVSRGLQAACAQVGFQLPGSDRRDEARIVVLDLIGISCLAVGRASTCPHTAMPNQCRVRPNALRNSAFDPPIVGDEGNRALPHAGQCFSNGKTTFQSPLHIHHYPFIYAVASKALAKRPSVMFRS
jgi:hypothetical protein